MSTDKAKLMNLQVQGQGTLESAPPLFSNFVAISRIGTEVQFEFIYVDINQLALMFIAQRSDESVKTPTPIQGQTVAKIVMPAQSFVQLKDHLIRMFSDIEKELVLPKEVQNASRGTNA